MLCEIRKGYSAYALVSCNALNHPENKELTYNDERQNK